MRQVLPADKMLAERPGQTSSENRTFAESALAFEHESKKPRGSDHPGSDGGDSSSSDGGDCSSRRPGSLAIWLAGAAGLLAAFVWSYGPTLLELVKVWDREPDYSHGYFVVPLALYFLWARRDRFPKGANGPAWGGLTLLALSIATRIVGARLGIDAVEGWSILFWAAGVAWLLGGLRVLWWSLPSVAFLWFMIPIPYRAERMLSDQLQPIAAKLSSWVLQCFGQPAIARANTILLGEHTLEVEQACSGLRIFVGIAALAFAYVVLVRRPWWEKAFLLISVVPIALIANSTRIVVTGMLIQTVSGEAAKQFSHDIAGWVMVPYAAALFALVLWYMGKLVPSVESVGVGAVLRRGRE